MGSAPSAPVETPEWLAQFKVLHIYERCTRNQTLWIAIIFKCARACVQAPPGIAFEQRIDDTFSASAVSEPRNMNIVRYLVHYMSESLVIWYHLLCRFYAIANSWVPTDAAAIKGVVLIAHGLHEHSLRYFDFAVALGNRGISLMSLRSLPSPLLIPLHLEYLT
jgi:hypothetical protein